MVRLHNHAPKVHSRHFWHRKRLRNQQFLQRDNLDWWFRYQRQNAVQFASVAANYPNPSDLKWCGMLLLRVDHRYCFVWLDLQFQFHWLSVRRLFVQLVDNCCCLDYLDDQAIVIGYGILALYINCVGLRHLGFAVLDRHSQSLDQDHTQCWRVDDPTQYHPHCL